MSSPLFETRSAFAALSLLLSTAGCATDDAVLVEAEDDAIVGGLPTNRYEGAVKLTFADHTCSGALISKRTVVTAAHCVTDGSGTTFVPNHVLFRLVNDSDAGLVDIQPTGIAAAEFFSAYDTAPSASTDVALVHLASDALYKGRAIVPLALSSARAPMVAINAATTSSPAVCAVVGFGETGSWLDDLNVKKKWAAQAPYAACVGDLCSTFEDISAPTARGPYGSVVAAATSARGLPLGNYAGGDSGAPLVCAGAITGVVHGPLNFVTDTDGNTRAGYAFARVDSYVDTQAWVKARVR